MNPHRSDCPMCGTQLLYNVKSKAHYCPTIIFQMGRDSNVFFPMSHYRIYNNGEHIVIPPFYVNNYFFTDQSQNYSILYTIEIESNIIILPRKNKVKTLFLSLDYSDLNKIKKKLQTLMTLC